jgi:hypothetical protein
VEPSPRNFEVAHLPATDERRSVANGQRKSE